MNGCTCERCLAEDDAEGQSRSTVGLGITAPDGVADGCEEHFAIVTDGPVCVICMMLEIERLRGVIRELNSHPLDCLHINKGSADAAAELYEAEYKAGR